MPTRHDVPVRRVVELTVLVVLTLSFDEVPAGHFKGGNASRFVHSRTIFFVLGHNYGIYVGLLICLQRRRTNGWITAWKAVSQGVGFPLPDQ